MSWTPLRENYTDAVWEGLKKYKEISNQDGTISLEDVTEYINKETSFFGSLDANRMNAAINIIMGMLENGTDLYADFQQYFEAQKILFDEETDAWIEENESVFTEWFEFIRGQLDEDAAGHLQNEIDKLNELVGTVFVDKPTVTDLSYSYDGEEHQPTFTKLDTSHIAISGSYQETNAGSHNFSLVLKDKTRMKWRDDYTNLDLDYTLEIEKVDRTLTLDSNVAVLKQNETPTISIGYTSDTPYLSVVSSDPSVATAIFTENDIVLTYVDEGTCTITVTANADNNHNAVSEIISVTAELDGIVLTPTSAPTLSNANLPSLNTTGTGTSTTQPTRNYYYGQQGNAFYGVINGTNTWELVMQRSGFKLASTGAEQHFQGNAALFNTSNAKGNTLLSSLNNNVSWLFSNLDQEGIKPTTISDNALSGGGNISSTYYTTTTQANAKIWPLTVQQYYSSKYNDSTYYPNGLALKVQANSRQYGWNSPTWTRTFEGYHSGSYYSPEMYAAWHVDNAASAMIKAYPVNNTNMTTVAAFNLDLTKVLMDKAATSDTSSTALTYVGTKYDRDMKFLMNVGTSKANGFSITADGAYSNAVTTKLNSGTNYISEIIYDASNKSIYYGNLGTVSAASGTVEFQYPENLAAGTYKMAIFEEEKCAAYKTDYASTPVWFQFTIR